MEHANNQFGIDPDDQNDVLDDNQVEDTDDLNQDDQVGGDGDDDVVEEEPFQIAIPMEGEGGKVQERVFGEDEVVDYVKKGTQYDGLYQYAQKLSEQVENSRQLVEFVSKDPVASAVTHMRAQGMSTEQIIENLKSTIPAPQEPEADPFLDTLDDTQRAMYLDMKRREAATTQKTSQLEQQMQAIQQQRELETVSRHNSQVFGKAIEDLGIGFTGTEAELESIRRVALDLYPTMDLKTMRFTKSQAEVILSRAGLATRKSPTSVKTKVQQVQKARNAPRVLGGTKTPGNNRRQAPQPTTGNLMEARRKALQDLGK